jgi:hypothetical protein
LEQVEEVGGEGQVEGTLDPGGGGVREGRGHFFGGQCAALPLTCRRDGGHLQE